jgi:inner membrane protein
MSNDRADWLTSIATSPMGRIVMLGFLVLLLQIPVAMIGSLGDERAQTRNQALADIASTWGGTQEVTGPFLVVPYRVKKPDSAGWQFADQVHHAVFLPERLQIDAHPEVTRRARGIYSLPVYTSRITLRGQLPRIDLATLGIEGTPLLDKALLLLRLSDIHAVDALPMLRWNGADLAFEPWNDNFGEASGVHVALPELAAQGGEFSVTLDVRGSGGLYFTPLGRETSATVTSDWPHPGFQGAWLPKDHDVSAAGFAATWSIPYIARGFPAAWRQGDVGDKTLQASRFGVEFVAPIDPYRMSERSLKYAALILGLTFLAVWLFEIRSGVRAHPVQYLLVGAGMCVFYLLELSLAEHLGFGAAYALASGAVVAQLGFYTRSVLRAWPRAMVIASLIAALYGLLYVLLREEDYALLTGSLGLFVALSAVMFLTRRVQWSAR